MTIICAQRVEGGVLIGSDSRVCKGSFVCPQGQSKWAATLGGLWVGWSGHLRSMLLTTDKGSVWDYVVAHRGRLRDDCWDVGETGNGGPANYASDLIIVDKGRVFHVHGSGSIVDFGDNFCAEGSGHEYAYGAAYALRAENAELRMRMAIEAACKYDTDCGGDVFIKLVPHA